MLATPGSSSSLGMVASSESSPAAQALPTGPISRTSPLISRSSSRSRPSTSATSSTKSSSRYVASSTSSTSSTRRDFFLSPSHFPHHYATYFLFSSHIFSYRLVSSRLFSSHSLLPSLCYAEVYLSCRGESTHKSVSFLYSSFIGRMNIKILNYSESFGFSGEGQAIRGWPGSATGPEQYVRNIVQQNAIPQFAPQAKMSIKGE